MAKKKTDDSHIVCSAQNGGSFLCRNCETLEKMELPASIPDFVEAGRVFIEKHTNCQPPKQSTLDGSK